MYWSNFLHFYQPPTQKSYWIKRITAEAYRPILKGLLEKPKNKVTININGILLELLEKHGETDVIDMLRELLQRGQIELTGSAKFHPLLPFLPEDEVRRQITLNEEVLKKYFGDAWVRRGFFPPEMGFNPEVARIVRSMGYKWIIVDELSFPIEKRPIDYSKIYTVEGLDDFYIHFRERKMSFVILSGQVGTAKLLIKSLGERLKKKEYLLTAMDGESFGHHRPGLEKLLFEIYDVSKLEHALISELPQYFRSEPVAPEASTWALMEKDLELNKPFSRWLDNDNEIHKLQWELTNLALRGIRAADITSPDYQAARSMLDSALHSDQYWWASARPWWSIEMIERGAKELLGSVMKMPGLGQETRNEASELYKKILFKAFDWQRDGIVDQLAKQEDEEVRKITDTNVISLPADEIEKMVKKLDREMKLVVKAQEFERAAQIRDRIAELKRYAVDDSGFKLKEKGDREWDS